MIIKPLMHMVSDFLRKKMTHIRTYTKKLAKREGPAASPSILKAFTT